MSSVRDKILATLENLKDEDLKKFHYQLKHGVEGFPRIPKSKLEKADRLDTVDIMVDTYRESKVLEVTLIILEKIDQNQLAEELREIPEACSSSSALPGGLTSSPNSTKDAKRKAETQKLKSHFKKNFRTVNEGPAAKCRRVDLNEVYTELYTLEGWSGGVSTEHEVVHIEAESWRCGTSDTPVELSNIFQFNSKVLTMGIAGVGKTVAVQRFVLNWAEKEFLNDMDFIFLLPFRELNLIKDEQYSFQELLHYFHPELKNLNETGFFDDECRSLFIFDGLDEFRVQLNFNQKRLSDVTEKATVNVLITNLIKGHLLRSALIWITSRPAMADQIPSDYVDLVTEVRGFNDAQKDEYLKKRLKDEHQARVIKHVKDSKSLHIMCHIPVFCRMMAAVLQRQLDRNDVKEIPKTLTEMYTHFLLIQADMHTQKYDSEPQKDTKKLLTSNKEVILKLAELAFKQLVEGKVVFYEEDLKDCDIDITEPSMYFGFCSEFFLEEFFYQKKVYCFVHLSFQEFLAAFYVFYCYVNKDMKPLSIFKKWTEDVPLCELLCKVVETNLWSQTGRLDLFLRFLVGISLESNQRLLQGLLTRVEHSAESIKKTAQFIKKQIQTEHLTADRSINLFLCLLEMNDQSLYSEIREFIRSAKHSEKKLNPAHCSAIAYILQMSDDVLEELDPKKYNTSLEGCLRLIPGVGNCRKAFLSCCSLTEHSCEVLASALQNVNSQLRVLDLNNNDVKDSGVKLLSAALESQHCKLEILSLSCCSLTEHSCDVLASALQNVNSSLRVLDLNNNDVKDSGVKLLSAALESQHCKLEILRLSGCMITDKGCISLAFALKSNLSLRELDLSYNNPGESAVTLFSYLKDEPQHKLDKLNLDHGGEFRMRPGLRKYACDFTLDVNPASCGLTVSEGNRKASWVGDTPDHPAGSDQVCEVVCVQSVCGRSYWEVECSEGVTVAVVLPGCRLGSGPGCWSLTCEGDRYVLHHDDQNLEVQHSSSGSSTVGVFLDQVGGALSFYSVSSHSVNHIHTFNCKITESLYTGFSLRYGASITLLDLH